MGVLIDFRPAKVKDYYTLSINDFEITLEKSEYRNLMQIIDNKIP